MGFFDQYRDRGPTVLEVFRAEERLRDAMLYDWHRAAAPDHTVFASRGHADEVRDILAAANPACVVVPLALLLSADGVFALDGETREPVRLGPERIPDLVRAITIGETPVAAVARLAGEEAA